MSLRTVLTLAGLLAVTPAARAVNYTWANPANGAWTTAANWNPNTAFPVAGDNVLINLAGTYTVTLSGTQAANNVTLNAAGATVNAFGGNFNLGGTMTLTAGNWLMGGLMGTPVTLTGGTITRGATATGKLVVEGDLRLVDTQVANAAAVELSRGGGGRLRLSGTANFAPGSVVTMPYANGLPYPTNSGITYESNQTLNNATVNLAVNTTLGAVGGTSLTLGPTAVVQFHDPNFGGPAVVGRDFYDGNGGLVTLTNQGTIRSTAGELYVGRFFSVGDSPSNVDLTNTGLIEASGAITIHANTFTNAPGGVVRAAAGGHVFVFGRQSWVNQGAFEVHNGASMHLGGLFTRDAIGTVTRTGTNTIGIYAARMDNSGGTWALTPATGSYQLLGAWGSYGEIIGGAITATGGAKLQVRPAPGAVDPSDFSILTGVQVGAGVLDFAGNNGRLAVRGGTTLTSGDTIALTGNDTALMYFQTQQADGLTFVLGGARSSLSVWDNHVLTLGPTTTVRKTGAGTADLRGGLYFQTTGTATALVNTGVIRVEQGTLNVPQTATFTVTNRGTVQVDAGATWQGPLATDGGTVQGGGTVTGAVTFTGTGNALRPGSSPGRLSTGSLTLNAGTTLFAELNGTAAGTGYDQVSVTGAVTLGGAALNLTLGGGYVPASGDRLFLIVNDGTDAITGEFAGLTPGSTVTVGGYMATISYTGDSVSGQPFGGNDVVLYNFTPVPEPGTALAMAIVSLGLVGRGCRRSWWRRCTSGC